MHDVRKAVSKERMLAYTTVMTLLDRLEKRGCVTRRKPGRSYIYRPKVSRDTMREHAVKQLLDGFFRRVGRGVAALSARAAVRASR